MCSLILKLKAPLSKSGMPWSALTSRKVSAHFLTCGHGRATLKRPSANKLCRSKHNTLSLSQPLHRSVATDRILEKRCKSKGHSVAATRLRTIPFWTSKPVWRRASLNTFRCLIGCTVGDFSSFWYLQYAYPELGLPTSMAVSMAAGITTSMLLETWLLKRGKDQLSWPNAAKTAAGMSLTSMLAMEFAENLVDFHLTGGVVDMSNPQFWFAALLSIGAGFTAPLPYNYVRLRLYGKSCH